MAKTINLSSKISLSYPKWFYKTLECLRVSESFHLHIKKGAKPSSTGVALLELLREEARIKKVEVTGLPPSVSFPIHTSHYSIDWFEGVLKPLFLERFFELHANMDEDLKYDMSLLFNELTQNAKDHSGSEKFLVLLEPGAVGVFDLGVTIPAKLEEQYSFESDMEAVEMALKDGITTRRLRSGGKGLYYTLSQLKESEGYLFIASRTAQLRRYIKSKKIDRKTIKPRMAGTLIYCDLKKSGTSKKGGAK